MTVGLWIAPGWPSPHHDITVSPRRLHGVEPYFLIQANYRASVWRAESVLQVRPPCVSPLPGLSMPSFGFYPMAGGLHGVYAVGKSRDGRNPINQKIHTSKSVNTDIHSALATNPMTSEAASDRNRSNNPQSQGYLQTAQMAHPGGGRQPFGGFHRSPPLRRRFMHGQDPQMLMKSQLG